MQHQIEMTNMTYEELTKLKDNVINGILDLDDYNFKKLGEYFDKRTKEVESLNKSFEGADHDRR